ncbi:MAG: hypothetical protein O2967_02575 [Proteobacteria bacterium]|nr:hypothetical protein [Pseudomonadota bacterium]
MLIGKRGKAKSGICMADKFSITLRGRDLCNELMGRVSVVEFFFLHVTGQQPTDDQIFLLDAMPVSLAEQGMTPAGQAARMTYAAHQTGRYQAAANTAPMMAKHKPAAPPRKA